MLGIAVLGTILTTKLKSTLGPGLAHLGLPASLRATVATALGQGDLDPKLLAHLSPSQQAAVLDVVRRSYVNGFHAALIFGGSVLIVAAIVANRYIPGRDALPVLAPDERIAAEVA